MQRWRGVAIVGAMAAVTLWLAVTGQLALYIHPRYNVFTVIMASIALVLVIGSLAGRRRHDDEDAPPPTRLQRGLGIAAATLAAAFTIGMIVVPPATLSTATADQRQINATAGGDAAAFEEAVSADADAVAQFTVREWATILRQTSDLAFFADKPVSGLVGFITPDEADPDNVFYVSRFSVTCCAVDAQPLGVPVYLPNWSTRFAADDWVTIDGAFASNPSRDSTEPLAIVPDTVEPIEQPREPYLF